MIFSIESVRKEWPNHFMMVQDLFPLKKYDFVDKYGYKYLCL